MIYTFGCSMAKWYWPTWVDWLRVYDQPVTNLANKGYGNQNIFWELINRIDTLTADDHLIIMWCENHRISQWYDREWIDQNQVLGFFPDTNGKLWFTNNMPYMGMYRTHPEFYSSFSNMIIDKLQTIWHTQMILDRIGCKYTMVESKNLWADGRPVFKPIFKARFSDRTGLSKEEIAHAKELMQIKPVQQLLKQINWDKFVGDRNCNDPEDFHGIWEYFINNKEYVTYKHDTDNHPNSLAHHDFALEIILGQDPKKGRFRQTALDISKGSMQYPVPAFSPEDYVIPANVELLDNKYKVMLENL